MALEVGSMLIRAKFDSGNIMAGIAKMNRRLRASALTAKGATTEFMRMKGTLIGLAAVAGLTAGSLLAMLTSAIMESPFLAAALAKMKNEFMLFGNAIAKYVAPVLEKVVDLIRFLRQKFEALPDSIKSAIVNFVLFGAIILTAVGLISGLLIALAAIKTALITLVGAGALAKLATLLGAIWALIAASLVLQFAIGFVVGVLGVMALDRSGVLQWVSDMGEGFRNWDSILRDIIVSLLGVMALLGGMAIDISRGDFGFSTTKAWAEQWKGAVGRIVDPGSYEYGGKSSTTSSAMSWDEYKNSKTTTIGNQSNIYNFEFPNVIGDYTDPAVQAEIANQWSARHAEQQQYLNV